MSFEKPSNSISLYGFGIFLFFIIEFFLRRLCSIQMISSKPYLASDRQRDLNVSSTRFSTHSKANHEITLSEIQVMIDANIIAPVKHHIDLQIYCQTNHLQIPSMTTSH